MQLFYNPELHQGQQHIQFSKEESRHMVRVLRKSPGDTLHITNGEGLLFLAEITLADQKHCEAIVKSYELQSKHDYNLHLAVAPTKMNDRYEWFLEKATEIGVDRITPIFCDNSERKTIKPERFEKILQSAMKQSLSCYRPKLHAAVSFQEFVSHHHDGQLFIAHCEDTNKKTLKQVIKPKENVTILIGPEGDFSLKEIEQAINQNFIPVALGSTRLRTETAAIVACHSVAFINQ